MTTPRWHDDPTWCSHDVFQGVDHRCNRCDTPRFLAEYRATPQGQLDHQNYVRDLVRVIFWCVVLAAAYFALIMLPTGILGPP